MRYEKRDCRAPLHCARNDGLRSIRQSANVPGVYVREGWRMAGAESALRDDFFRPLHSNQRLGDGHGGRFYVFSYDDRVLTLKPF